MSVFLETLRNDDSAQDTTEYVLLVGLIALAVTVGISILASSINDAFAGAGSGLLPPPPAP